ncbi:hypothetical protein SDC9_100570 [bioreactor metagenome]|uniref:Uncharacterized protein n=1 Tax=bioreactor metagenome TaxID=1076179 RepID=A0A645AND0_9ZZZZ
MIVPAAIVKTPVKGEIVKPTIAATIVASIGPRVGTASNIPAKIAKGTAYFRPSNK